MVGLLGAADDKSLRKLVQCGPAPGRVAGRLRPYDFHLKLPSPPGYGIIQQFQGVPIFFSLSGFLVLDSLLRARSIPVFFKHRALRIYPALFVCIFICELALALGGGLSLMGTERWRFVVFEAIYGLTAYDEIAFRWSHLTGGIRSYGGFFKSYPNSVFWTLTVELTFYLVVALFAFAGRRRGIATILIVATAMLSMAYMVLTGMILRSDNDVFISMTIIPYFWMFAIGMLFRLWMPPVSTWRIAVPVLILAYLAVAYSRGFQWFEWKDNANATAILQSSLPCLLAVWIGISPLLKGRWIAQNDASYGTYLYHMVIVSVLVGMVSGPYSIWWLPVIMLLAFAAGMTSWRFIERPTMRWRRSAGGDRPVVTFAKQADEAVARAKS